MTTALSPSPAEPLGDIEIGLSLEQAEAIVKEFDALWASANGRGKRRVRFLQLLRDELAMELKGRS